MSRRKRIIGALVLVCSTTVGAMVADALNVVTKPATATRTAARMRVPDPPQVQGEPMSELLSLVNAARANAGLGAVSIDARLMAAAQAHSNDMAARRLMSHTGSDGSNVATRITRQGFTWSSCAENIAAGQTSESQAMTAWMGSAPHKANILGRYTYIGLASAQASDGTWYWTMVLANGS